MRESGIKIQIKYAAVRCSQLRKGNCPRLESKRESLLVQEQRFRRLELRTLPSWASPTSFVQAFHTYQYGLA